ncbi:MAG: homoserine kinase [Thiolinea sp.]
MSVFTSVSRDELVEFLSGYDVGELIDYSGIEAGVENTNYFVSASAGRYVLTLFEKHQADELLFYLELMQHLAAAGIPVACPVVDQNACLLQTMNGKPAALIERLSGSTEAEVSVGACAAIGQTLARIHLAAAEFPQQRYAERGHAWRMQTAAEVLSDVSAADAELLRQEINFQQSLALDSHALPQGIIHADLFLDNALFDRGKLTGVIDWYYACNDFWLYDLAVVVNDWCCRSDGALDEAKLKACLWHYHQERPLTAEEAVCWPGLLRAAALRFWLSRLLDQLYPRAGEIVLQKDPGEFRNKLLLRIGETELIRSCWPVRL